MTGPAPMCLSCRHLCGDLTVSWTCEAYPEGIPGEITSFEVDNRLPYSGDHGIQFEPKERPRSLASRRGLRRSLSGGSMRMGYCDNTRAP
jgi:hypothetical protein